MPLHYNLKLNSIMPEPKAYTNKVNLIANLNRMNTTDKELSECIIALTNISELKKAKKLDSALVKSHSFEELNSDQGKLLRIAVAHTDNLIDGLKAHLNITHSQYTQAIKTCAGIISNYKNDLMLDCNNVSIKSFKSDTLVTINKKVKREGFINEKINDLNNYLYRSCFVKHMHNQDVKDTFTLESVEPDNGITISIGSVECGGSPYEPLASNLVHFSKTYMHTIKGLYKLTMLFCLQYTDQHSTSTIYDAFKNASTLSVEALNNNIATFNSIRNYVYNTRDLLDTLYSCVANIKSELLDVFEYIPQNKELELQP